MGSSDVQDLFRTAIQTSDSSVMRRAVETLFAHSGPAALSPEAEYELRHEDYVMEMPQSRVPGPCLACEMGRTDLSLRGVARFQGW